MMQLSGERVCVDVGGDLPGPLLGHRDAPRQQAEQGDGQVDISDSRYLNILTLCCAGW